MLPAARIMCSRSARFTVIAINFPALLRCQNATERIALSQALAFFGLIEEHLSNLLPGAVQNFEPLLNGGRRAFLVPPHADSARFAQTRPRRVLVDLRDDRPGHRQAALIDLFVCSHMANIGKVRGFALSFKLRICPFQNGSQRR
jgi:hypothetical protein